MNETQGLLMDARRRLKRDHEILRSKLNVLESALRMWPESWFIAREMSFTITRLLGGHIEREEQTTSTHLRSAGCFHKAGHNDALQQLQAINGLFANGADNASAQLPSALRRVITTLRRQLFRQDQRLLRLLKEEPIGFYTGQESPSINSLIEEMTVNQVMRIYPATRRVFDALFISSAFEGYECLDEVAWKHGMETFELIAPLRAAIELSPEDERDSLLAPMMSGTRALLREYSDGIRRVHVHS